jgi:catechol 2,3-dioxygenase-like lactoylglutathione lyase family enzyme
MALDQQRPTLGSLLLSSPDPQRLEQWYSSLFAFGNVPCMFDKRDDVTGPTADPGRYILNFHTNDARAAAAQLDAAGATWLSPLEERNPGMFFGTVVDPDGNYVQIIQLSDEMIESAPPQGPFASFAVRDLDEAASFYRDTLGLRVVKMQMGVLTLVLSHGGSVMIYPKPDHEPANFTVMNFPVDDLVSEVDRLTANGVEFQRYDGFDQDERGIAGGGEDGPNIAWLCDPSGNVIGIMGR